MPDVLRLIASGEPIRHGRGVIGVNKVNGDKFTFTPAPSSLNEFSVPSVAFVETKYDGRFDDPTFYG